MYYEVHGEGPKTLLVLHGGGGGLDSLSAQIGYFSRTFRVIAPEQMGQGRTGDAPRALGYHSMAEDTLALMDLLKVDHAACLGWSDGGVLCLDLAMNHPERIDHVVVSGANFRPDGVFAADRAQLEKSPASTVLDHEAYARLSPDGLAHIGIIGSKLRTMWLSEPQWTTADLSRIKAPTLVIGGQRDLVTPEHMQAMIAAIPHATGYVVPGTTHLAPLQDPDLFNKAAAGCFRR
jgi:pimeloyl-ACP methyl ester carboxylesterase